MDLEGASPLGSHVYELPRPGVKAVLAVPEGTPRGIGVGLSGQCHGGQKMRAWRWEYSHGIFFGPRVR